MKKSTLENALQLLDLFTPDEPEMNATEIAARLGVANSTVHRLVTTLMSEGFIAKDTRTNQYSLGTSILSRGNLVTKQYSLHEISHPILQRLVEQSNETAHLAVLRGFEVIYLQKIECSHPIRLLSHLGKPNPAHCTSSGQVLLAHQPPKTLEKLRTMEFLKYTSKTITDPEALLRLLHQIKKQG